MTEPTIFIFFFAFFLLLQELSFPGDVAAVALGGHILAEGVDGGAGNDLAADGPLDGDLELVPGDFLLEAVADLHRPLPARDRCAR